MSQIDCYFWLFLKVKCADDNCERYGGKASLVFSFVVGCRAVWRICVYTVNIE